MKEVSWVIHAEESLLFLSANSRLSTDSETKSSTVYHVYDSIVATNKIGASALNMSSVNTRENSTLCHNNDCI
jgi:hypothetical protein